MTSEFMALADVIAKLIDEQGREIVKVLPMREHPDTTVQIITRPKRCAIS